MTPEHQKEQDERLKSLEKCNEDTRIFLVKLEAGAKDNNRMTREIHRAIYGNGHPKDSMLDRMATAETKLWVIFGILIPVTVAIIIEIIKKI